MVKQIADRYDALQHGVHLVVIPLCSAGKAGMNIGKPSLHGTERGKPTTSGYSICDPCDGAQYGSQQFEREFFPFISLTGRDASRFTDGCEPLADKALTTCPSARTRVSEM
jgi:hypothetical protein